MNDRSTRQQTAFRNLGAFINANAADFSAGSLVPGYGTSLITIADDMDRAASGQLGGTGADVTAGLLGALLRDLQLIGAIARANDAEHPGLADKFPTVGTTAGSITSTADAYLKQLEPSPADTMGDTAAKNALIALFTANEMPATFVVDLRTDRDLITPAMLQAAATGQDQVKSTSSLAQLAQHGMQIRAQANAALRARYSRQTDKLRAAESAAHIERAPKRAANAAPATPGAGGGN